MFWSRLAFAALIVFSGATVAFSARTAGSIAPAPRMLAARAHHSATLLPDGKVLIAGGMRRNGEIHASAEVYDPAARSFRATGAMKHDRVGHIAVLLRSGQVLVAGVMSESRFKLPPEAVEIGAGRLLIAGGGRGVEIYDVSSGRFAVAAGRMNDARHFATETRLRDGTVLVGNNYGE